MDRFGISKITDEVSDRVQEVLGDKLRKIILFGSCARGDFDDESDIDVMVLADVDSVDEFQNFDKAIWDVGWEIGLQHDVMVSVFLKDSSHFSEWMDAMAFYRNVTRDGVVLYGS